MDRRSIRCSRPSVAFKILTLGALALSLSACETIPRASPGSPTAHGDEILRYADVVPLTGDNIVRYRMETAETKPALPRADRTVPEAVISPGDFISVRIFESGNGQALFSSAVAGGSQFGPLYVSPAGFVDIPFIGKVKAADLSLTELAARIKSKAAPVSFSPEVIVTFVSGQASTITVSGDAKAPGRYSLLDGIRTALDAVDRAGGTTSPPYQVDVVMRRGNEVRRVSLWDLMNGQDFSLQRGDDLVLVDSPRLVTGLGAITKSGNYPLPHPGTNLIEVLGVVGGLVDQQSDRTGVVIYRPLPVPPAQDAITNVAMRSDQLPAAPVPRPVFFTLDMSQPVSMVVAQQFQVQPGDVLYVTDAPVNDIMKFLNPILRAVTIGRYISSTSVAVSSGD